MNSSKTLSRRSFLKNSAVAIGSVSILSRIIDNNSAEAQVVAPLDESNPTAVALGYKHNAEQVDVAKFPKRAGEQGKKQKCVNCMFYSQGGQKIDGKDGTWGKCTLFPTGLVAEAGWCNSWAIKPGMAL
jgi:hypothetical protein